MVFLGEEEDMGHNSSKLRKSFSNIPAHSAQVQNNNNFFEEAENEEDSHNNNGSIHNWSAR